MYINKWNVTAEGIDTKRSRLNLCTIYVTGRNTLLPYLLFVTGDWKNLKKVSTGLLIFRVLRHAHTCLALMTVYYCLPKNRRYSWVLKFK